LKFDKQCRYYAVMRESCWMIFKERARDGSAWDTKFCVDSSLSCGFYGPTAELLAGCCCCCCSVYWSSSRQSRAERRSYACSGSLGLLNARANSAQRRSLYNSTSCRAAGQTAGVSYVLFWECCQVIIDDSRCFNK